MQVIIDPGCLMRLMLHVLAAYEAYIISVFMRLYSDRICSSGVSAGAGSGPDSHQRGTMQSVLAAGSVFFPGLFLLSKQCFKRVPGLCWSEGDAVLVSAR